MREGGSTIYIEKDKVGGKALKQKIIMLCNKFRRDLQKKKKFSVNGNKYLRKLNIKTHFMDFNR